MPTPPVLVLAWRRPDLTAQVLDVVARSQPERLFLACDGVGPDAPSELADAVRATRQVLDREPDWPCTVERRYADRNLGLRRAVSGALDWFFASVDEGIVLEDDCLPHPDFFGYCEELLARHREDPHVMCISGDNSSGVSLDGDASYGFIRWPLIWGWATWRRAWQRYDHDLERVVALPETRWEEVLPDPDERRVWQERLASLRASGRPDSWAFVWALSVVAADGLCALPAVNLVTNAGFGPGATHTAVGDGRRAMMTSSILPLRHPTEVVLNEAASRFVFDRALGGASERQRFRWERTLRGRLRVGLHRLVARLIPKGQVPSRLRGRRPPWRRA